MIQTNLLLSIGFSLVSNFTNVVPVRPEAVPTPGATVEIDGRTGTIVALTLFDEGFSDEKAAEMIRHRVFTPDPASSAGSSTRPQGWQGPPLVHPQTNSVIRTIPLWLAFCSEMGISTGPRTNLADVDWSTSCVYTSSSEPEVSAIIQVRFKSGAFFEYACGAIIGAFAPDCCYAGIFDERTPAEWEQFKGPILKHQRDLATNLQAELTSKLRLPADAVQAFRVLWGKEDSDPVGTIGVKRALLEWRNWPWHPGRMVPIAETRAGFGAEFDLETGELKFLKFFDPALVKLLANGQLKNEPLIR